jgi:hypothetical protein
MKNLLRSFGIALLITTSVSIVSILRQIYIQNSRESVSFITNGYLLLAPVYATILTIPIFFFMQLKGTRSTTTFNAIRFLLIFFATIGGLIVGFYISAWIYEASSGVEFGSGGLEMAGFGQAAIGAVFGSVIATYLSYRIIKRLTKGELSKSTATRQNN